jgi:hypothetical protein
MAPTCAGFGRVGRGDGALGAATCATLAQVIDFAA